MKLVLAKSKCWLRLFALGGVGYPLLELLWRGHTHWSMALAGGCALLMLAAIAKRGCCLRHKCLLGALAITAMEFCFGLLFNVLGGLQVWDYSTQPFNIMGQVCLPFSLLWLMLCTVLMPVLSRVKLY